MQEELNGLFGTTDVENYNTKAAAIDSLSFSMQDGTNKFRLTMYEFYRLNNVEKYTLEHLAAKQNHVVRRTAYEKARRAYEATQREVDKLEKKKKTAIKERLQVRKELYILYGPGVDPDGETTKALFWSLSTLFGESLPNHFHPSDDKEAFNNNIDLLCSDPINNAKKKKAAETYQQIYEKWIQADELQKEENKKTFTALTVNEDEEETDVIIPLNQEQPGTALHPGTSSPKPFLNEEEFLSGLNNAPTSTD
jgi:hypothetical protein